MDAYKFFFVSLTETGDLRVYQIPAESRKSAILSLIDEIECCASEMSDTANWYWRWEGSSVRCYNLCSWSELTRDFMR